jgi:hypothetical protein
MTDKRHFADEVRDHATAGASPHAHQPPDRRRWVDTTVRKALPRRSSVLTGPEEFCVSARLDDPDTRISTPLIYLLVDASPPGLPIPSKATVSNDGGLYETGDRVGVSVKRQAAARQGHPGLRQRRPRQHADETWPRRRVPAHGLSHCLGKRETSLRGWTRHHRSGTRGYEGVRLGRRSPHLPAGRRVGRPSRAVAGATTPGSSMRHNRGEGRRRRRCARKICEKEVWQ